ncbi:MAG TPA: serine hydrolase domain-containing protein [Allosphingosinicella sp.]|jgi:CubicO group peptidase (beta-lactamase class C family)
MRWRVPFLGVLAAGVMGSAAPAAPRPEASSIEPALGALTPTIQVAGRAYPARSLPRVMRENHVPSVSIAFVANGRVAWVRAFGRSDVEAGRPATTDTLYQAASISKPVTATAALALVDRGLLRLDAPVNSELKTWRIPDNDFTRAQPVTLRHLLTHTAGVTVHGFPGYGPDAPLPTVVQILDGVPPANIGPIRVDEIPGRHWRYSGGGFTIVQLLLTDVAGRPFPELLRRLVLDPSGMTRSSFGPLTSAEKMNAARGYREDGSVVKGGYNVYPELAAAGLWTTPGDLARWALAVSKAYRGETGGPIRPAIAREMLTPGLGGWGLGVGVRGTGEWLGFSHAGANEGYRADFLMFPRRGEGIFIMTNGDGGAEVFAEIVQAVGRGRGWPDSAPRTIVQAKLPSRQLQALEGRYSNGTISVTIGSKDGSLIASVGSLVVELVPLNPDDFINMNDGARVHFERDATGLGTGVSALGVTLRRQP